MLRLFHSKSILLVISGILFKQWQQLELRLFLVEHRAIRQVYGVQKPVGDVSTTPPCLRVCKQCVTPACLLLLLLFLQVRHALGVRLDQLLFLLIW